MPVTRIPIEDRFAMYVTRDSDDGCWLWRGKLSGSGYGQFKYQGRWLLAHRASYELHAGAIPDGLQLDHLCRVRTCVNPAHLEPVTSRENVLRAPTALATINAGKTHCPQGHEYSDTNTYWSPRTGRLCRTCQRNRPRKRSKAVVR